MRTLMLLTILAIMSTSMAKADEKYDYSSCENMNWLQKEICEAKIFQKTNWQNGKEQTTNTINKIKSLFANNNAS